MGTDTFSVCLTFLYHSRLYMEPYLIVNIITNVSVVAVVYFFRSMRVLFRMSIEFTRDVKIGIQHVVAHFTSHPQLVSRAHEFDIEILIQQLDLAVEEFNKRG